MNTAAAALASGVIEGFFGQSWSWLARLSNIEFLADRHFQFYIYAPKSDSFLRRRWHEPIPAETIEHLQALSRSCRRRGLTFGLGFTPFEIYLNYDASAKNALRAKVEQINSTGTQWLCLLFDDMRGNVDGLAELQSRVVSDICGWSNAERFILCPTYYSDDPLLAQHFGSPPKSYLSDLGRLVDHRVDFFWTGEKVISDTYSEQHLANVAGRIGRKPFIWDNHCSNDSRTRTPFLFLDASTNGWRLPIHSVAGLAINPLNQPHLSRIALATVQRLLSQNTGNDPFRQSCFSVCKTSVAQRLIDDIDLMQRKGLASLDERTREVLLERYTRNAEDPYCREVASWLRGEYVFDPQCLTT
jgi:hypothetical protein